jgi:hypothetical protein
MTRSQAGMLALHATQSSSPDTVVDRVSLRNMSWTSELRTKTYLAISNHVAESSLPGLDSSTVIQLAPHLSSENCLSIAVIWSCCLGVRPDLGDSVVIAPSMTNRWALSSCES